MQDPSGGGSSRFPPIAPRDAASQSPVSQSHLDPSNIATTSDARRQRPPRSRAGCWTCRTRKVKCDEQRPSCGQCRRLGHSCDYNPRLAFKDDTPRVVERMQEDVSTIGSFVWNPNVRSQHLRQQVSVEDLLPPFSALTTDEEREKKAESRNPGTLYVIANPRSFESLPEYRNENTFDTDQIHGASFNEVRWDEAYGAELAMSRKEHLESTEDPNTVILTRFEDPHRRVQRRPSRTPSENPGTPTDASIGIVPPSAILTSTSGPESRDISMLEIARQGGKDAALLQHYRTAISQGLRLADKMGRNEDIFETHARVYPPLFHALMALSALSISQKNGGNSADSLEHYQKVIPALKEMVQNSSDSYSDGALFTHYILLVYEIFVIGDHDSNMWEHHLNQLLRIVTLRRQTNADEPYAFLVWQVYCIDIHALLSCSGSASFVEGVLERNMVPPPEKVLAMWSPGTPFHPSEEPYFPALIRLNQEAFSIALQVGQLARILREEATQRAQGTSTHQPSESVFHFNRRTRIQALIQLTQQARDACNEELPDCHEWAHESDRLPQRVFASIVHSYLLVRACILYVYTSMYPGQLFDPPPNYEIQVGKCSQEIIEATKKIISEERFELRVIVFPLFMAGYSTMDPLEKSAALDLMRKQEQHSYGGSTAGVRKLLETVCEKQATARDSKSVDWIEEMRMSGQRLVMCGL